MRNKLMRFFCKGAIVYAAIEPLLNQKAERYGFLNLIP